MHVDEAGHDGMPRRIEDLRAFGDGNRGPRANLNDALSVDQDRNIFDLWRSGAVDEITTNYCQHCVPLMGSG